MLWYYLTRRNSTFSANKSNTMFAFREPSSTVSLTYFVQLLNRDEFVLQMSVMEHITGRLWMWLLPGLLLKAWQPVMMHAMFMETYIFLVFYKRSYKSVEGWIMRISQNLLTQSVISLWCEVNSLLCQEWIEVMHCFIGTILCFVVVKIHSSLFLTRILRTLVVIFTMCFPSIFKRLA